MPRDGNPAILPEARNDENLIIVQLHKAVAKFHNAIVDHLWAQGPCADGVRGVRRLTRWHYQWAVTHDFLPRFSRRARRDEWHGVQGGRRKATGDQPSCYKPRTGTDGRSCRSSSPAAYRFGHSIIRPSYIINDSSTVDVFGSDGGFNLIGGRPVPADLVIQWKNILPVDPDFPARKPRKIDTKLSPPLTKLPESVVPPDDPTIRNTLRGKHVGLPSGQQVARAMRTPLLSNATLGLSNDPGWGGEAPLWYYILKEAELSPYKGEQLGPVGGRIMAEVLVGLLQRDPNSCLYLDAAWKPGPTIAPADLRIAAGQRM